MIGKRLDKQFYSRFSRRFETKTVEIVNEFTQHGVRMYTVLFVRSGVKVVWNADVAESYEGWK